MASDWLQLAWTQTWQVTALVVAVALLVRLAAANRPQLAYALWLVVFVKCITPPLWSSPSGAFCWLQTPRTCAEAHYIAAADDGDCRAGAPDAIFRRSASRHEIVVGVVADAAWEDRKANTGFSPGPELPTTPAVEPSAGRRPPREGLSLPPPATLLAAFWLAGVGLVVGWKTWRRWRFARLLGRCGRVDSPACERIAARLGERLRLRRRVGLIVTERLVGPAVFGLLRPTVLMPQTVIEGKPAKELELMLAHELIHVRRGDLWFAALRSAVEALWWFHPPVWWAGRRAAREAERCCDEAVLAELQCGPGRYARCLLDVLEAKHHLRSAPACPGVRAIEVTQGRLERIMRIGSRGYRRTPWWCWAIAIAAAAAAVPGAAIAISANKAASLPPRQPATEKRTVVAAVVNGMAKDATKSPDSRFAAPVADASAARSALADCLPPALSGRYASSRGGGYMVTRCVQERVYRDGVTTYPVDDILDVIHRTQGLDERQSREFLKKTLKAQVQRATPTSVLGGKNLSPPPIDMVWLDNIPGPRGMMIETTAAGHRRVDEALALLRRYGTAQIVVEVRFVSGPAGMLKKTKLDWTVLPSELPPEAAANYDGRTIALSLMDRSFDGDEGLHPIRSESKIEKVSPMMYALLDDGAAAKLVEGWKAEAKCNVLAAPRLSMLNGGTGFVSDCSQTPFVVAVADGKPQIRVVNEGAMLHVRPVADKENSLKLGFRVEFSKIRSVETAELSRKSEREPVVSIQIPEVEKLCVEGGIDLPCKKWLLLGGLERKADKGAPPVLVVMLRAEKIIPHLEKERLGLVGLPSGPARPQ